MGKCSLGADSFTTNKGLCLQTSGLATPFPTRYFVSFYIFMMYTHRTFFYTKFGPWAPWGKLHPPRALLGGSLGAEPTLRDQADAHFVNEEGGPNNSEGSNLLGLMG